MDLEMSCAKNASTDLPIQILADNEGRLLTTGFQLPAHNGIEIQYVSGTDKPSYMTFKLNGTAVQWLMFTYTDGNLTRIQPD